MVDEVRTSMQQMLGKDREGDVVEINVFDTVAKVIACTANRVFVSKEIGMWSNSKFHQ
jgi:hypothetical protein